MSGYNDFGVFGAFAVLMAVFLSFLQLSELRFTFSFLLRCTNWRKREVLKCPGWLGYQLRNSMYWA
jgi:hypothetical protein